VFLNKEEELHECLIPIHFQVVDNASIAVHKLAKKLGGTLISCKTDCITVENATGAVLYGNERGSYRKVTDNFIVKVKPQPENKYKFELVSKEWNSKPNCLSKLINGMAGSGKSFTVKQDLKKIQNYALTATTNRAARLIGGKTIHSLLGMKEDGSIDKTQALKIANSKHL
jgi:hypothetical protein